MDATAVTRVLATVSARHVEVCGSVDARHLTPSQQSDWDEVTAVVSLLAHINAARHPVGHERQGSGYDPGATGAEMVGRAAEPPE